MSFTAMTRDLARNPTIFVGEILVVVIVSIFFENIEHWVYKRLKNNDRMGITLMNVLFKEITLVGFVMFTLFCILTTGAADKLAFLHLEEHPLVASFETVRMMMFLVMVVLVAQATALWLGGQRIRKEWGKFEHSRSFGTNKTSMESEFTKAGYLTREPDPEARSGVTLVQKRKLRRGLSFLSRLIFRQNKLVKLLSFRAMRHEFLFPTAATKRVPDPATFSFESYLAKRLGSCLVRMISVDTATWFATLLLLGPPMFYLQSTQILSVEAALCTFAWGLVLAGFTLLCLLEEDIYRLTPVFPDDLRRCLKLFTGDSLPMLRRQRMPSWKGRSLMGRRYRPGLGDAEMKGFPTLGRPPAMRSPVDGGCTRVLSSQTAMRLTRLLVHFQAILVATLALLQVIRPMAGRLQWGLYLLSWAAWPLMLLWILPLLLRRLTKLSSIELEKDERAIRTVTFEHKDGLLVDFRRLVQLLRFEYHAAQNREAWTQAGSPWGRGEQIKAVAHGNSLFDSLNEEQQLQVWAIFASWDPQNAGDAELIEVEEVFKILGFASEQEDKSRVKAQNLLRLVDFDNSGKLSWIKFKAIVGLATVDRPEEEVREDLTYFFNLLDTDGDGILSSLEIAEGFDRIHVGITADDLENLLLLYYGEAKPLMTIEEFIDFVTAKHRISAIRNVYDYAATHSNQ